MATTKIMNRVNDIITGNAGSSIVGAYVGNLSLSDLGVLESARRYLAPFDPSEKLYGDHYGWVTVGEYIGHIDRRIDSIMRVNHGAGDLAVTYATEWRKNPYQGAVETLARGAGITQRDMLALIKHGCRVAPRSMRA